MPIKQSYARHGDACATAHAMELLGDKWTYPVLRELMLGPKRFGQLAASVRGVTPAVLTARLREMTRNGLVRPSSLPPPTNAAVYELTDWARELAPVFESLGRWAQASPTRTMEGGGLTPDAAVQSMLTMAPHQPLDPPIDLTLHLYDGRLPDDEGYRYRVRWAAHLDIVRGTDTDVTRSTVTADSSTWAGVLHQGQPLDEVDVEGAPGDVEHLVAAFRAPAPAHLG